MSKSANLTAANIIIQRAAVGLPDINTSLLSQRVERGLLESMTQKEIEKNERSEIAKIRDKVMVTLMQEGIAI